ncbi:MULTISPECIES: F0F1 ATP synthase subunit B [Roseivirga]|jgi:F-type H+-transporting ATPase subunit b|uniref:F0F1 ATP synthase subunit B n=1 Tax=Roseivirga TaxID=290180 RepID=UPI001B0446F5|nr:MULTISPECIES: F0F1 ATP synthase subunit B [Roseivirga]MBO6661076.1 F0F1 ATP synthase subunit B [Roseivirga sp.]MBO6761757.1 F0F1 ATP synthase subunit B [Roseivirga sp.]MBO6908940.1 F0F1 ATP synthase subunit B [Roseivirga sp.]WPZ11841.1 F0F1 ATP synthase subunit B [Roseivirga spongicola]|tara:strand:- start:1030 stop:1524 length:495 start_codon:yes stop_codon:yes gene_type:complete
MDLLIPDTGLFILQTVAFIILLIVLGKFAWKPILSGLKEREQTIESALLAAEQAKKDMQALQADNEKLLAEARSERDAILKEAMATANSIKEEAKEETSKITAKMLEDAKATIENEKRAALAEVKTQVAALSLDITEKVIRKQLSDKKAQEALVDEYVKDLNLN